MMKIFPQMSLEYVKRMDWLDAATLIACHNNDMRERKRKAEREQRKQRAKSKMSRIFRR